MNAIEYKTIIQHNGSKWAGDAPDPIEKLYDRLQSDTLDPRWERMGDFCFWQPAESIPGPMAMLRFFGNFYTYSHGFDISTNDPKIIERLTDLIQANKSTPGYAQAKRENQEWQERQDRELGRTKGRRTNV
jgi:hypothetical protein